MFCNRKMTDRVMESALMRSDFYPYDVFSLRLPYDGIYITSARHSNTHLQHFCTFLS